jgi:NAD(P)-dependent dehydrogenase (short-subunit alcohol dehydrogenase family)
MTKPLEGKIAVVAGATRGAGRGIATALGEAGATVYCTGRSVPGTPLFVGRCVAALAADPNVAEKNGRVFASCTLRDHGALLRALDALRRSDGIPNTRAGSVDHHSANHAWPDRSRTQSASMDSRAQSANLE